MVVIFILGYSMFGSFENLFISFVYLFKDNRMSMLDGDLNEDISKSGNFILFLVLSVGLILSTGYLINQAMGGATIV